MCGGKGAHLDDEWTCSLWVCLSNSSFWRILGFAILFLGALAMLIVGAIGLDRSLTKVHA